MANIFRYFNKISVKKIPIFIQRYNATANSVGTELNEDDLTVDQKTRTVHNVESLLKINIKMALKIVNENKELISKPPSLLSENFEILLENDINTSIVLRYPHLLGISHLRDKICKLKKLPHQLNVTIVLAGLPKLMIDNILYDISGDRISQLSELFEISPKETCEFLYKRNFLVTKSLDALKENLKFVKEFGISLKHLRRDPWVLRYSREVIKYRIEFIRETDVEPLTPKPWMLRSPIDVIENHFQRRQDNRNILGNASLTEYLSERLGCTEEQAKYLVLKMPALRTKSLRTISDIITLLYSKGFQPHHIYRTPKILVHSIETTKKRLEQMEKSGIKVDSLYMLTKSHKQFIHNFEAMVRMKKGNLEL